MADKPVVARAPTGTHDVLWPESARWEELVARFASPGRAGQLRAGPHPDVRGRPGVPPGHRRRQRVVGKEMYEFEDRGGRLLALRPEGTAPMVRAFVQHRPPVPWKAWYVTPAFRYERPQAGRYRQHHQLGVEAMGPADPDLDVEVVALADRFFRSLGLHSFDLRVNSMGDDVCRPAYLDRLRAYLEAHAAELCAEHRDRIDANPLRVLDCKRPECLAATAGAPALVDHLCDPCRAHFERVPPGPRRAGREGRPRPPTRARFRLLHPDDLRVLLVRPRVGPERDRRGRSLRRTGRDARRSAHSGHRIRHRHRAVAAGLRRRGCLRRRPRAARRLRGRRGGRGTGPRPHRRAPSGRAPGRARLSTSGR